MPISPLAFRTKSLRDWQRSEQLKVVSCLSTQRFKSSPDDLPAIAKQLGVANVLQGSVQRSADQVRVNVQLVKG